MGYAHEMICRGQLTDHMDMGMVLFNNGDNKTRYDTELVDNTIHIKTSIKQYFGQNMASLIKQ